MKILYFFIWVMYQTGRLIFGLITHPYKTVREIMRGVWFVPLLIFPAVLVFWMLISGRIAAWVVDVEGVSREVIALFYSGLVLSLVLWQGLLLYLGFRFGLGLRRK